MMIIVKSMRFKGIKLQNSRKTRINMAKLTKGNYSNNKHSDSARREHRATTNLNKNNNKHTLSHNIQTNTTPNRTNLLDKLSTKNKNCNTRNNSSSSSKRKKKDSLLSMSAMRKH